MCAPGWYNDYIDDTTDHDVDQYVYNHDDYPEHLDHDEFYDLVHHLDHLVDHPYTDEYLFDHIHHFIVDKHHPTVVEYHRITQHLDDIHASARRYDDDEYVNVHDDLVADYHVVHYDDDVCACARGRLPDADL